MTTAKGMDTVAGIEKNSAKKKICHPSVCVGDAQPSSCVCPITPKK